MSLAGAAHITIAPALLEALNTTTRSSDRKDPRFASLFEDGEYVAKIEDQLPEKPLNLIDDEERFRMMFTRRDKGVQEIKQVKAINVFADMQEKLEEMVRKYLN
jgi:transaldolase